MEYFLNDVLLHHFYLILYGVIGWFLILWVIAKNKSDEANGGFSSKKWWSKNYDEFVLSLFVGLSFVIFDDEIKDLVSDLLEYDLEYSNYHYLLAAPLTDIFIKLVGTWKKSN